MEKEGCEGVVLMSKRRSENQRPVIIHSDFRAALLTLGEDKLGKLLRALLELSEGNEKANPKDKDLDLIWHVLRAKQRDVWERHDEKVEKCRTAGQTSAESRTKVSQDDGRHKDVMKKDGEEDVNDSQRLLTSGNGRQQSNPIQSNPIQIKTNIPPDPHGGSGTDLELDAGTDGLEEKIEAALEGWWMVWPKGPRKADKKKALKKLRRVAEELGPDVLTALGWLQAAVRMRIERDEGWTKNMGQYVESPMVWINQRRWEAYWDEVCGDKKGAAVEVVDRGMNERNPGCDYSFLRLDA